MTGPSQRTFHWKECAEVLGALTARGDLRAQGRAFVSDELRVQPPLVFPLRADCRSLADYLDLLPAAPARHTVILMQAGAVSLGLFERGEELATKSFRRYVVRGRGRAQPLHLATKGKSRYGSRLRLQNARLLLEETNAKLCEWAERFGPSAHVYCSSPVRLWPSVFTAKTKPPFAKTDPVIRIPLDLPKPTTDVLRRAYRSLCWGRIDEFV